MPGTPIIPAPATVTSACPATGAQRLHRRRRPGRRAGPGGRAREDLRARRVGVGERPHEHPGAPAPRTRGHGDQRARVQHLRAVVRQLGRLAHVERRDEAGVGDDARVGGEEARHVLPQHHGPRAERGGEHGRRQVGAAAAERHRRALGRPGDEARHHGHRAAREQRPELGGRALGGARQVGRGRAVPPVGLHHRHGVDVRRVHPGRAQRRGQAPRGQPLAAGDHQVGDGRRELAERVQPLGDPLQLVELGGHHGPERRLRGHVRRDRVGNLRMSRPERGRGRERARAVARRGRAGEREERVVAPRTADATARSGRGAPATIRAACRIAAASASAAPPNLCTASPAAARVRCRSGIVAVVGGRARASRPARAVRARPRAPPRARPRAPLGARPNVAVDAPRGVAPLADRPHHERRPAARVARGEHPVHAGHVLRVGGHVAERVEAHRGLGQEAARHGPGEAERDQHEVHLERERAVGHLDELRAAPRLDRAVGPHADRVERAHAPALARQRRRGHAPLAPPALLVRVRRLEPHRPQRPRGERVPLRGRPGRRGEVVHLGGALPVARADAVRAGVAAAEHRDPPPAGRQLGARGDGVAGDPPVLLDEEVHRRVHPRQLAPGHGQRARRRGAAGEEHGVVRPAQRREAHVAPGLGARPELDPLRGHLREALVEHRLVELEVGHAVAQQPADAVVLLEHGDRVAHAPQLLRGGEAGGARTDDRHVQPALARRRLRPHPPLGEPAVGHRLLDAPDGDGLLDQAEHARRLARRRAQAAGELGEVVRGVQRVERLLPAAAADEVVPLGDQVLDGAAGVALAEGDAAVHAAGPLRVEQLRRCGLVELRPGRDALRHRQPPRLRAADGQECPRVAHRRSSSTLARPAGRAVPGPGGTPPASRARSGPRPRPSPAARGGRAGSP
jgi:hypothetical protein